MKKIISIVIIFFALAGGLYYFGVFDNTQTSRRSTSETKNESSNEGDLFKIIAVGDSLTAGYGLPLDDSYPMQLEARLLADGHEVEVVNAGISGETTAGLLDRVEFIKSNNPDMVLITIGGNDALRNLPIANTEENITKIIQSLKEVLPAEKIFLMSAQAPLNLGLAYVNKFNSMYENIEEKEGIHVVPFVVSEVFLDGALMQDDRIHPNKTGYAKLIDKFIYKEVVRQIK